MTTFGTRALRSAYHVARLGLFRYAGGDPERVHEAMIGALAAQGLHLLLARRAAR